MSRKQKSGTSAANSANDSGACGGLAHGAEFRKIAQRLRRENGDKIMASSHPGAAEKYRVIARSSAPTL